jgi:hypothetical protein
LWQTNAITYFGCYDIVTRKKAVFHTRRGDSV